MHTFFRDFCFYVGMFGVISAQMLPDSQAFVMNELEHLYFDYTGPQGFKSGVIPCTNYVDSTTGLNNNTLGRQTSAQWIRTAFRMFILSLLVSHVEILELLDCRFFDMTRKWELSLLFSATGRFIVFNMERRHLFSSFLYMARKSHQSK